MKTSFIHAIIIQVAVGMFAFKFSSRTILLMNNLGKLPLSFQIITCRSSSPRPKSPPRPRERPSTRRSDSLPETCRSLCGRLPCEAPCGVIEGCRSRVLLSLCVSLSLLASSHSTLLYPVFLLLRQNMHCVGGFTRPVVPTTCSNVLFSIMECKNKGL